MEAVAVVDKESCGSLGMVSENGFCGRLMMPKLIANDQ